MIVRTFAAASLAIALCATPAFAQDASSTHSEASTDAKHAAALELMSYLMSEELVVGKIGKLEGVIFQGMMMDPNFPSLEKQLPGIGREIAAAIAPSLGAEMLARLPELQRRGANLAAKSLNHKELVELNEFYGSPTGRKFLNALSENMEGMAMLKESVASQGQSLSVEAAQSDLLEALPETLRALGPDEIRFISEFEQRPVARKVEPVSNELMQMTLSWSEDIYGSLNDDLEQTVIEIVRRRMTEAGS